MEVVLKIKSWGVMYFSQIVVNGDFVGDGFTFSIEFEVWQAYVSEQSSTIVYMWISNEGNIVSSFQV